MDYPFDPSQIEVRDFVDSPCAGVATAFTVDASHTAQGLIEAHLPVGQKQPIVEEVETRIYRITYEPSGRPGDLLPIRLSYAGQPLFER